MKWKSKDWKAVCIHPFVIKEDELKMNFDAFNSTLVWAPDFHRMHALFGVDCLCFQSLSFIIFNHNKDVKTQQSVEILSVSSTFEQKRTPLVSLSKQYKLGLVRWDMSTQITYIVHPV